MQPLLWLVEANQHWRPLLTELFAERFVVRQCTRLPTVWKDLVGGEAGVLVVDLSGATNVARDDCARLRSLASLTPVLLLIDDPGLAYVARFEYGGCHVLLDPFDDLDRLLNAAVELSGTASIRLQHGAVF
jgi:hypothetical protein